MLLCPGTADVFWCVCICVYDSGAGISSLLYLLLVSVWNVNGGFCDGFSSHVQLTS